MELFASNLRKRAEELGISHAEVARRAGLSETRYGNYVSGRREPDLATLVRISAVLGTTPNDLLTTEGHQGSVGNLMRNRAVAALAALDANDLERVVIMVEALANERM
ncbi:transcriptional regulator [Shinella sp. SUS2]|uniref:helix-turn-helix domain-containing protein n=1 Tax=unclassified Shinella TaxID=2643062 RepID=UPI0006808A9D|nr:MULTISPECIES: helix-turn-helix transcriptional regulator [unclassified Shinella]KNY14728.1 transcriptional regulator [Shinella sp. SUS2]KOC74383.1 transcriptional regulator [Shinella sp. GWS1]